MLNWLFPRRVFAIDFHDTHISLVKARKNFFSEEVESFAWKEMEKAGNLLLLDDFSHSIEDIIVTSANMDSVIFISSTIPKNAKRRDIENIGKIEAARNFGLAPEEIFASLVGMFENKGLFAVARKESIENSVIKPLSELGLPEPDVVIPDMFKYFYVYYLPKLGKILLITVNFLKGYYAVLLYADGQFVSIRHASVDMKRIMNFFQEETGMSLEEMVKISDIDDVSIKEALKAEFTDLSFEIGREISLLGSSGIMPFSPSEVDLRLVLADPEVFQTPLKESLKEVLQLEELSDPSYRSIVKLPKKVLRYMKGAVGLMLRGVEEYGKAKPVHLKEEKS